MASVKENIRLRQWFLNMARVAEQGKPIPPERDLAEKFGVTRKTVRRALAMMVEEKYLIKSPRRGYFPNPGPLSDDERKNPVVGLIFYSGMQVFYLNEELEILEIVMREFRKAGMTLQILSVDNPKNMVNEISGSLLEGVLWLSPPDELCPIFEKLADQGMNIAGFFQNNRIPEKGDYVFIDHGREEYQQVHYLLIHGARRILKERFVNDGVTVDAYLRACREFGVEPDGELLCPTESMEKLIRERKCDAVTCRGQSVEKVRIFAKEAGIRIPEDLQLISGECRTEWNITKTVKPYSGIVSALVNQLKMRMEKKETPRLAKKNLNWKIIKGVTTHEK